MTKKKIKKESFFLWLLFKIINAYPTFHAKIMSALRKLKSGLAQESVQTKQMLFIYAKQARREASAKEIAWANNQFRDVIKSLGLGVILFLPFAPITLPLLVKISRKLGFELLPDSFQDIGTK